jgi:16S rRNA (guanine966-N2)-methyltransferase
VLDLFAGSGSLAFEAASRGARHICLVENSEHAVRCLERNAAAFGLCAPRCRILREDALRLLARRSRREQAASGESYGVVFMDPPYGMNLVPVALQALVRGNWLAPGAFVLAEMEAQAQLDENVHEALVCVANRRYGQTRTMLWQAHEED